MFNTPDVQKPDVGVGQRERRGLRHQVAAVIAIAILGLPLITGCVKGDEGPAIQEGSHVRVSESITVNPRDYGPPFWLLQQRDNCTLRTDRDYVILSLSPNYAFVVPLNGENGCRGYVPQSNLHPSNDQ